MQFRDKAEIESYYKGDKIQCLICGKYFKALGAHINKSHGLNVDLYKEKFGLPWSKGLCGCVTADRMRDNAETARAEGRLLTGMMSEEHEKKIHKKGHRRITPAHSDDRRKWLVSVIKKRSKYPTLDFRQCWRLFESGLTQKEIGESFGVSQMTISRFMRGLNKYQNNNILKTT
jgi:hypothetical protein